MHHLTPELSYGSTNPNDSLIIPIKVMERYEAVQEYQRGSLTVKEACIRCQVRERQFYRLLSKVREAEKEHRSALTALVHGNTGKESNRQLSEEEKLKIKQLISENYSDFGPTLAAEKLEEGHGIVISSETLRILMIWWGYWKAKPRRSNGEYRQWRERRSVYGEVEQLDGGYHAWFEERAEPCCLLASIDDATGKITGLLFVEWEGVFPSFRFCRNYLKNHGKPGIFYLDKHSTYKINTKTLLDDPEMRTQFGRACQELGIELVSAHSPQAKGRVERLFKTLQDRLVKELRLRNISTKEEANRFVKEEFIPAFNRKFAVVPKETGDAHRKVTEDKETLDRIFSVRTERVVMNDFTVQYKNRFIQLLPTTVRLVRRKEKVEVRENEDGVVYIYLRGAKLPSKELPKRPEKVSVTKKDPKLLAHVKHPRKPAPDHPWRRSVIDKKKKNATTLSVN